MTSVAPGPTMDTLPDVIQINPEHLRSPVDTVVRDTVEKTLNDLLQAEAEELCGAAGWHVTPLT
jgi:putative transposase